MTRIFIGVAWPYANGPFHIGHLAGAYLPGDIFARFHRLRGSEVLMVSGSDMHGTPILVRAEKEGASPESIARRYDEINRGAFERLGFSFDLFTSTHTIVHEKTVQELFLVLLEHRLISRKTEDNAYCPHHQRFLPDRYLVGVCPNCGFEEARGDECDRCGKVIEARQLGQPRCSLCGTPAEFRPTEHFYLGLELLAPRLTEYLADKRFWRPSVTGVTQNFLTEGLHPTPITRDLDWGIPLPLDGYPTKRFYVWFDAVIGYLSASREWAIRAGRPDAWRRYWAPEEQVRQYYFLGKDNIFFHTVVWPAILLGHGELQVPYDVCANAWLLVGGVKLAKSSGAGGGDATIPALLEQYPPDVIRFYAAQLAPQNHDTEFDWNEFHQLANEVLSNQWGNLVQRVLVLVRERCAGKIPEPPAGWDPSLPSSIGPRLHEAHREITRDLDAVHLKEALDRIFVEVREGNRRFHDAKPWSSSDGERERTLYETLWLIRAAATWLSPYLPFSSAEVFRMLGEPEPPRSGDWERALQPPVPLQSLGEVRPLFPKDVAAAAARPAPPPPLVPAAPLPPLAVRVAVVREVKEHPAADRLYILTLDVGDPSPRTVVAGLRPSYPAGELVGRRVALLANLEPRTIRRITSQGMVLAADSGDRAVLVRPPNGVAAGLYADGTNEADRAITYDEFQATPLVVGTVEGGDADRSRVEVGGRLVTVPGSWETGARVIVRLASEGAAEGVIVSFGPGLALEPASELPDGTKVR
ncbi:MAG: methionine--tRNA ligase [Thermoplasmata archaeon]|nr:methionine--tRNA ligase [Thermoplasmata archaeon]